MCLGGVSLIWQIVNKQLKIVTILTVFAIWKAKHVWSAFVTLITHNIVKALANTMVTRRLSRPFSVAFAIWKKDVMCE